MTPSEDLESRGAKNRGGRYSSSFVIEDSDSQWTSWLVPMFLVANVAVFVVSMCINNCPKENSRGQGKCVAEFLGRLSFQPLKENPLLGPSSKTLEKLGALEWNKIVNKHQGWRLVTSIWLHAGVIHLAVSTLSLMIGIRFEKQFGFVRIGVIYLLSGFGGNLLSSLFIQNNISVGGSGALFGLLGAILSELITNWYKNKAAPLLTVLAIAAVNLTVGILPRVNNFAHIGGFLTGFFMGFILMPRRQDGLMERPNIPADDRVKSKYKACRYVCWAVSLVLLIAGFTVGLVMLYEKKNASEHCNWCHYIDCVPASIWHCDDNQS